MIIDFRRYAHTHIFTSFKSQIVDLVQSWKYLETIIESKLNFEANCEAVFIKRESVFGVVEETVHTDTTTMVSWFSLKCTHVKMYFNF